MANKTYLISFFILSTGLLLYIYDMYPLEEPKAPLSSTILYHHLQTEHTKASAPPSPQTVPPPLLKKPTKIVFEKVKTETSLIHANEMPPHTISSLPKERIGVKPNSYEPLLSQSRFAFDNIYDIQQKIHMRILQEEQMQQTTMTTQKNSYVY